ncbi:hypothetical protein [Methyloferula stellata]|uniref:hypothetical protein n=1 Tax=Methyloferula stellata TaxID=876270 RepID=UPI00036B3047|nr:hypothetical protein [Methyloferula stellata]
MKPFPPAADLTKFEGGSIAQVRLDPHGVQFAFDSGRLIVAEYRIEQIEADGSRYPYECLAQNGSPLILHRLLYRRIEAIRRADLNLTFEIEGGSLLTVFADIGPYESGNISGPDYPFTIF